jgi:hypothetical protein
VCVYIPLYGLYGYKRKEEEDILDFRGVPHLSFLAWTALIYNLFLTQKQKKMFTTRKVYSPYGISYTQKKKKTLKMFEKKKHKKKRTWKERQAVWWWWVPTSCVHRCCKDKSIG